MKFKFIDISKKELIFHILLLMLYFSTVNFDIQSNWFKSFNENRIPTFFSVLTFPFVFYVNSFFLLPIFLKSNKLLTYVLYATLFSLLLEMFRIGFVYITIPTNDQISDLFSNELFARDSLIFGVLNPIWYGFLLSTPYRFLRNWAYNKRKIERLEKEKLISQLSVLKAQINPHFLFNNLNTLEHLIDKDQTKAKEFLQSLANIYRHSIEQTDKDLIDLEIELDYIKDYTSLIKMRFGNAYKFEFSNNLDKIKGFKIPPGALQTLIENAIKHNKADEEDTLTVHIILNKNEIIVSNTKKLKENKKSSLKTGLSNLIVRYEILAKSKIEIVDNEKFTIKLPQIKHKDIT